MGARPSGSRHAISPMGPARHRPVCHTAEQGMHGLLFQSGDGSGLAPGRFHDPLDKFDFLCFPSDPNHHESVGKDHLRRGHRATDHPLVTMSAMVLNSPSHLPRRISPTPSSSLSRYPEGGHDLPPRLAVAETDCMEDTITSCDTSVSTPPTVPAIPAQQSLHPDLQYILESALRPSTRKSYAAKWQRFSNFANLHSFLVPSASVSQILQFLFELHQSGLKPSSIRVYTAAISHYRGTIHGQPQIKRFLRGLSNLHPTIRPLMPTWSLSVVLQALTRSPFEPMATIDLRLASWKTAFLVAVTSARRSSELCALRVDPPFLNFHKEKVVLRLDPSFLLKVATSFHMQQEIVLPAFFPTPSNLIE
ncbi:Exportin-T [Varanus komodoensis]|nr:Exportin-T [Varanus komodoensis]